MEGQGYLEYFFYYYWITRQYKIQKLKSLKILNFCVLGAGLGSGKMRNVDFIGRLRYMIIYRVVTDDGDQSTISSQPNSCNW